MPKVFSQGRSLVIGIANYPNVSKLPEVVLDDARDIAKILRSEDYCGYPREHVHLLLDEQGTADGIRQALRRVAETAGSEDTVVVFFSGHGGRVETGPDTGTYLIPYDCNPHDLRHTAIGSEELTTLLSAIRAQRLVVLLDACHSAGVGELKAVAPVSNVKAGLDEKTYNALAKGVGRVIMASSRPTEVSLILFGMDNSLFTHYLLEALKGACPTHNDGLVRVFDIFHYISDNVPARAVQHPIFKANEVENNFPLALKLGGKNAGPQVQATTTRTREPTLSGPIKLLIQERLVDRWSKLATYFDIPDDDQAKFQRGDEPKQILLWLGQRKKLSKLRDAFNFLGWDDLIEVLDSNPI